MSFDACEKPFRRGKGFSNSYVIFEDRFCGSVACLVTGP